MNVGRHWLSDDILLQEHVATMDRGARYSWEEHHSGPALEWCSPTTGVAYRWYWSGGRFFEIPRGNGPAVEYEYKRRGSLIYLIDSSDVSMAAHPGRDFFVEIGGDLYVQP